jgi:type VI protein secretion system component VasA
MSDSPHDSTISQKFQQRLEGRALEMISAALEHACRAPNRWRDMLDRAAAGLLSPVPPLALAQFAPGTEPVSIPAGTALWANIPKGAAPDVKFRTAAPANLWPIEVGGVACDRSAGRLTLTFKNRSRQGWRDLRLSELQVYCLTRQDGSTQRDCRLLDTILDPQARATLGPAGAGEDAAQPVSLQHVSANGPRLLPPARAAHEGLALLREFLVFLDGFAAFTLSGIGQLPEDGVELTWQSARRA